MGGNMKSPSARATGRAWQQHTQRQTRPENKPAGRMTKREVIPLMVLVL